MSGLVVSLTPSEWGDVLQGLKVLINQPGISEGRATEIRQLGRHVKAQVDLCQSETPEPARIYDVQRPECPLCEGSGWIHEDEGMSVRRCNHQEAS